MRSTSIFATALAFAASAFAQTPGYAVVTSPTEGQTVAAGQPFSIVWQAGQYTGAAQISLLGGETPTTLVPGPVIASSVDITTGSFTWDVPSSLGSEKTYGIKITDLQDGAIFQYSFPFTISASSSGGAGEQSASATTGAPQYPTLPPVSSTIVSSSEVISSSSSAAVSSTSVPSYPTLSVTTSKSYPTTTPSGNLSSIATPTYPTTVLTSTSAPSGPAASATTTAATPIPTAGASSAAASSLALLGGLIAAFMAL
ncbi:Ser-Thr-rich glycosyl-phosphatidyl-inositol-anchored membrane family-domain-containing protein [Durotheca rogersii]|uniref:Ser-Thr-rich glycosyl-phosphatidyl-inositol-anchored membrane family-domain-containing protein n=1 Tax=Durotheca rogersii TaxID=419775 RepID=UPI002220A825|nr:Ser-Thr-rich glycosyl-phosphatidyl-inositol-anchored membrane family-domain-containing protein [Durotheca rogersii]KAI5861720.1 Ser-Thr-rich glycosyl-phosphatidyl-inositol-anchored membrane family-domain-containing protein [Durotheca rogersii]